MVTKGSGWYTYKDTEYKLMSKIYKGRKGMSPKERKRAKKQTGLSTKSISKKESGIFS